LAEVIPFRGLRYNLPLAGDAADLVSPPYDIISPDAQRRYHEKNANNAIHLDFGLDEPGDSETSNRYTRAGTALDDWIQRQILTPEPDPAFYLLREDFTGPDGQPAARTGFMAAVRLAEFSEGVILPHEETASGPKQDRLRLMEATDANLSPIFCLYSDPGHEITGALEKAAAAMDGPAIDIIDDAGIHQQLWAIRDEQATSQVTKALAEKILLIADGHHRYETALAYRNARRQRDGDPADPQPYDYLMVYLANMDDSAPQVLPIHRLVCGLAPETVAGLPAMLEKDFEITKFTDGEGNSAAESPASQMIERLSAADSNRNAYGLYLPKQDSYYLLVTRHPRPVLNDDTGHSAAWRSLEVSVLDRLVLAEIMGIRNNGLNETARVNFVERTDAALAQSKDCDAAFFVNPTSMAEIRSVAEAGEKMPQKSTYFHPKPLTGLVFRSFRY